MDKHYNHKNVEIQAQKLWEETDAFRADDNSQKPKFYALDMFPYPSGAGLHVGHPEGYTATDIVARYKRMNGFEVLHPMGWDSFGLPAENYAIKVGIPPAHSTTDNINNFRRQIKSLGFSYDWEREIATSAPEYYKWTQWIFLKLYERGLAYKKKAKVNWCDGCQTVLANEQVVDGKCDRSGDVVIQKDLEQWFFKITDYAEELLTGLDNLDWPEPIKQIQRNWIGRSSGAEIDFSLVDSEEKIKIFTTRPDTIYGATYIVLSPEHELVEHLRDKIENIAAVEDYIKTAAKKSDLERTDLNKDKNGVELQGVKAVNPANGEGIPIFIADYVLATYGTGAIMAVPAHDERDFAFAKKYNIEIKQVIQPNEADEKLWKMTKQEFYIGAGRLKNSGEFDGMKSWESIKKITEKVGGELKTQYRLRDWLVSRQRYWGAPIPIVYDKDDKVNLVKFEHLPLELPTDVEFKPHGTSPLGSSQEYKERAEKMYGVGAHFEIDTMDTFVCSSWYYLRYCDPYNQQQIFTKEKIAHWLPVDLYVGGAEHAVLHLLYARFLTKAFRDMGLVDFDEPFIKLRNQGMILAEDGRKMSKSLGNVINPDEVVEEYGADTFRLYEMFMGPLEDAKPWSTQNIIGIRRFLEKLWLVTAEWLANNKPNNESTELKTLLHKTIKKVTDDIDDMRFNTAISALMVLVNTLAKEKSFSSETLEILFKILSPFAPHISQQLWQLMGHDDLIMQAQWPVYDNDQLVVENVQIAVQVNGKLRSTIVINIDATDNEVVALAKQDENIIKHLANKEIVKIIYVKNRLLNIVIK